MRATPSYIGGPPPEALAAADSMLAAAKEILAIDDAMPSEMSTLSERIRACETPQDRLRTIGLALQRLSEAAREALGEDGQLLSADGRVVLAADDVWAITNLGEQIVRSAQRGRIVRPGTDDVETATKV